MADPVRVGDVRCPRLAQGPQVKLTLQHLAQQLATASVELLLQLAVAQARGLGAGQPAEQLLKAGADLLERAGAGLLRGAHRRRSLLGAADWRRLRSRASPAAAWVSSSVLAAS